MSQGYIHSHLQLFPSFYEISTDILLMPNVCSVLITKTTHCACMASYLKSPSTQTCIVVTVPPVECLIITLWNDVCAESDTLTLFSHPLFKVLKNFLHT